MPRQETPLFCTLCAGKLSVLQVEDEGTNLGCESGHKFFYSPSHLETGDILVIGDISFQCANDAPYPELAEFNLEDDDVQ